MNRIKAFILGMREFRLDYTTHFDGVELLSYDYGREYAHRITMRIFDS